MPNPLDAVFSFHDRTRHRPDRYADGPGYLDWANQPEPFRRWAGTALTELPLAADRVLTRYEDLFAPNRVASRPVTQESIGAFFELALGLSAWKSAGGTTWALRCNPSSGNLHPTEGYLLATAVEGIPDGVHHYNPYLHALEQRWAGPLPLPDGHISVGLSSIHWREAWKYGERAYRYCQHDVGHALATLRFAAAALGWRAVLLEAPSDNDIAAILGLDREPDFHGTEPEHPDAVLLVGPDPRPTTVEMDALVAASRAAQWTGIANRLSAEHREWPAIEDAACAARKPRTAETVRQPSTASSIDEPGEGQTAESIIRTRRSAQAFDGVTGISRLDFLRCLSLLAPGTPPWDVLPWQPLVHPVFILHRVDGLTPGLYAAPRSPGGAEALRASMNPDFAWEQVEEAAGVPLFFLQEGDGRGAAKLISCHQDIASDGAFTLGMLGEFEPTLRQRGAWWYRRLFWESGVLGHVLYLQAEAVGLRGTGIGCYFDDLFHEMLGITDHRFQSLYHFTVGAPVEDSRLQTGPPYGHRRG